MSLDDGDEEQDEGNVTSAAEITSLYSAFCRRSNNCLESLVICMRFLTVVTPPMK